MKRLVLAGALLLAISAAFAKESQFALSEAAKK